MYSILLTAVIAKFSIRGERTLHLILTNLIKFHKAEIRVLIRGGGILPEEFLLKSTLITTDFKKIRRAEQEDVNIYPELCISSIVQEWRK